MPGRSIFYSLGIFLIAVFSLLTREYTFLVFSLLALLIVMLLDNLGKGIVLREVTALFYAYTCLLMPWIGFAYYNMSNPLALKWVKYMMVSEDHYFTFALPAISLFCLAITFPLSIRNESDKGKALAMYIAEIKITLGTDKKTAIALMLAGTLISFFNNYLPIELQFFATLCFFASFAGLLYVFFAPAFKNKTLVILIFIVFNITNALNTGMFTLVAYMGLTIFSFFYLGRKTSLLKKVLVFFVGISFFLVLQNTKKTYRIYTWQAAYEGNKELLFAELFLENIQKGRTLLEEDAFFPVYVRTNQGFNVSLVMRRFPVTVAYDDGKNLLRSFFSSLVPRFLWPDKPQAGGTANMLYYAGWQIRGYSTNVGPLGEAYGSFGITGGIFFMFFLGAFIRIVYSRVFKISRKIPLLLLWIPVLFFQTTYSAETDTLQILNSLFKTSFFIWLLFKARPAIFYMSRKMQSAAIKLKTI
jgi:hypothetical protein